MQDLEEQSSGCREVDSCTPNPLLKRSSKKKKKKKKWAILGFYRWLECSIKYGPNKCKADALPLHHHVPREECDGDLCLVEMNGILLSSKASYWGATTKVSFHVYL